MFLEIVKFGNGLALELRDLPTKMCVYYVLVCALESAGLAKEIPDIPEEPLLGTEMDDFVNECFGIVDDTIDENLRWLMLCTDLHILPNGKPTEQFNETYQKAFGVCRQNEENTRKELFETLGIARQERVWMIDRCAKRVFCVHFEFASPIYKTSLLAGVMLKHQTFLPQYTTENEKTIATKTKNSNTSKAILERLINLMPKDINDSTTTGILESKEVEITEFIIKDAKMWCGSSCFKGVWLGQQLNVWFKTPVTDKCWFRPTKTKDPFLFNIGVLDEITTPKVIYDAERWEALSAPSPQNTLWRYPHGDRICQTPNGMIGIGHFQPLFDENCQKWSATHHLCDVRLFRLYKTQYPFVYSLMPDDDNKVRALKSKLKRSTESNPSLAEKGKEDMKERIKTSTEDAGKTKHFTGLIATLPTLECERYVKAVFAQTPKFRYRLFHCAKFIDNNGKFIWIPVAPEN